MTIPHKAVVYTVPGKCRQCYVCVRSCPVQAIKVRGGQAQVITARCVGCGICVQVCSQGAKRVKSDTRIVWQFLRNKLPVTAIPSSSFPAAFPNSSAGQLVTALLKLGFTEVMEAAFGAELVARAYRDLTSKHEDKQFILTCCPAVVDLIEKFYPQLLNLATPIVSPMVAMGRLIKQKYNPQAKVVFIGPCIAKKMESESKEVAGDIDAVLTFAELRDMLAAKDIVLTEQEENEFSGPKPHLGRMYAVPGTLLKMASLSPDIMRNDVVVAEGREQVLQILEELAAKGISARFVELFFCTGCVSGPMMGNNLSLFRKKELITEYTLRQADPARTEQDSSRYADVNLSRPFTPHPLILPSPTESELNQVLIEMNKQGPKDNLNCGACGYQTCRELATAIFQGLAEKEMCWPYLMKSLQTSQRQLTEAASRRFYLEHIARALEEERKHIARELHDSASQTLIAILHEVENFLEGKVHLSMEDTRFLWELREDIRSVLHELRQVSHNLRPAILDDLGLVPALAWLTRQQKMQEIETQFRVIGTGRRLPSDTELALFRITQEALRNVSRHSSASLAQVTLAFDKANTVLTISDNGTGFHVPTGVAELAKSGKLGLIGIQERTRVLGGSTELKSEPGNGTTLTIKVPSLSPNDKAHH